MATSLPSTVSQMCTSTLRSVQQHKRLRLGSSVGVILLIFTLVKFPLSDYENTAFKNREHMFVASPRVIDGYSLRNADNLETRDNFIFRR